jgi:flagellar hook-associated protein 3 FlgL
LRITNKMIHTNFLQNLDRNKKYLEQLHNRIASGKMINRPSDNPVAVSRVMTLRSALNEMEQFDTNMRDASSWLEISDTALGNINNVLQRARELAVYGAGGTFDDSQLKAIGYEIDGLIRETVQITNTVIGDSYIFGGTHTTKPPFELIEDANGMSVSVIYHGDFEEIKYEVSPGVYVSVNTSSGVFGFIEEGNEIHSQLFKDLIDLKDAIMDGDVDKVSEMIGNFDDRIDDVLSERASLGARSNRMDMALERSDINQYELTKLMARLEDTDYAKATIDFSVQQSAYHAAIKSGAMIIQPTLLDFLK